MKGSFNPKGVSTHRLRSAVLDEGLGCQGLWQVPCEGAQPFHFLQEMQEHPVPLQKENRPVGGGGLGRPDKEAAVGPGRWLHHGALPVGAGIPDLGTMCVWMASARLVSVQPGMETPRPGRGAQLSEGNTGAMWALRATGTQLSSP